MTATGLIRACPIPHTRTTTDPDGTSAHDAENEDHLLIARVINDGQRSIVLDRDSFTFYGDGHAVKWDDLDCLGRDTLPPLLNPGTHCEIGIFVDAFAHQVGAAPGSAVELSIEVKDLGGKRYLPRSTHTLLLEVNEIVRRG